MAIPPTRVKNAAAPQVLANGHDTAEIATDEAVIEVDGVDTGAGDAVDEPVVDPGVAALQAQLDEQKRRADNAEAERDRLRGERQNDAKVLTDSRLLVIESTIKTKEAAKDAVKQRLKDAKEAGDTDAEITATDELQMLNNDLRAATLGKDRLEQQIEEAKNAPADQLEAWFDQNNIGQQSRDWLRSHTDYLEDPVKNAELTLADRTARAAGIKANTPEYFEHIETKLGLRNGAEAEVVEPEDKGERRGQTPPSAPVSRGGSGAGRSKYSAISGVVDLGGGRVRVPKEMAEAAQISGLTVTEWLDERLKLERGSDGQLH